MNNFNNFKTQYQNYLEEIRPDLSPQSRKLYANQLNTITLDNNLKDFNPLKLIIRLTNKALRNKTLDFITLDGGNQTKNQRLSAVRNVLESHKNEIEKKKYDNLTKLISSVGDSLRNEISIKAGTNIKSEDETKNMKVTWDELGKFAKDFKPALDSSTGMRDYLILNLMLNNYQEKENIKYYVLLRVIEYASLFIWTNRKKPPNKQNYIWLFKNQLYIQHSKTTGGVMRVGDAVVNQPSFKTYPLNEDIKKFLLTYIKKFKIKNNQPIFYNDKGTKQIDNNFFSKILKELLKSFGSNMSSTMLRKIYENRKIEGNLNANQTAELNKYTDHSMEVAATFYSKKD
jgi:hypothetical protein